MLDAARYTAAVADTIPQRVRSRPRFVVFGASALAVLVVTELGVRIAESRLPEPLEYFSADAQTMARDLDELERRGIRSDLTFVGTSMVRRGIDANRFESELEGVDFAHNVALPGSQAPVVERWLFDEVVPSLHPRRVIWGLSSIDFNAGRTNKTIERYERARATEHGIVGSLDRGVAHLAISAHRDTLRDPYELAQSMQGSPVRFDSRRPIGDRAVWELDERPLGPAALDRLRDRHRSEVRDEQLVDFSLGDEELAAFRRAVRRLQNENIEVVIVIMPVPSGFRDLHPGGASQFDEFRERILAETSDLGAAAFDLNDAMADDDFRDYEHLIPDAARRFSDLLADKLRTLGWYSR